MSESEHTPGPWSLDAFSFSDGSWRVRGDGKIRAIVPSRDSDIIRENIPEGIANARLIAAAPELLEACKQALGAFENNNAIDWNDLQRAIDKAEGRTI